MNQVIMRRMDRECGGKYEVGKRASLCIKIGIDPLHDLATCEVCVVCVCVCGCVSLENMMIKFCLSVCMRADGGGIGYVRKRVSKY